MNFSEFIQTNKNCHAIEEGFALWKIGPELSNLCPITWDNMHIITIVLEGEMTICFDRKPHLLTQNCFADIIDKSSIELSAVSENISAYQLFFTGPFIANLLKNKPPFPITYVLNTKKNPISILNPVTIQTFSERARQMENTFQHPTHYFRAEMLKCNLWMFFMDIANAHLQQQETNKDSVKNDRKELLFVQFIRLLFLHICENHTVNFYASKLCITPQYLNRITRSISEKTVYEWISMTLLGEITQLLENTDESVQQIADKLNFPDQATLTKFFKRQTSNTPTEYKKKL